MNSCFISSTCGPVWTVWALFSLALCSFQSLQSQTTAPCWTRSKIFLMSCLRPSALLWTYCSLRFANEILLFLVYTLWVKYYHVHLFCICSFCARTQWTGFISWRVSRCRPSFMAFHSTLSSLKRRLWKPSWSSGLILTGQPQQWEACHWTISIALTVIESFILLQLPLNCLLLWPTWTWAQLHSRLVKHKTGLCLWAWIQTLARHEKLCRLWTCLWYMCRPLGLALLFLQCSEVRFPLYVHS